MKERPILFSGPMIKAILEGRKTQTRRVVRVQPAEQVYQIYNSADFAPRDPLDDQAPDFKREIHCPYGGPGDRLWVRETWAAPRTVLGAINHLRRHDGEPIVYRADTETLPDGYGGRWSPSIHMYQWMSRITLELVAVRVERVQDISEADIKAEGVDRVRYRGYTSCKVDDPQDFSDLWDSINGARPGCSWTDNPWVWCLTFKRLRP